MEKKSITVDEIVSGITEELHNKEITSEDRSLLNSIDTLINELRGKGVGGKDFRLYSADELSRIAGSLALLKDSLVEVLTKASRYKSLQENVIRLMQGNWRGEGIETLKSELGKSPTQDDIKAFIEKRIFRARLKLSLLEEYSEKMLYKWRSLNSLLSVLEGRIKVLMSQGSDTKLTDTSLEIDYETLSDNT